MSTQDTSTVQQRINQFNRKALEYGQQIETILSSIKDVTLTKEYLKLDIRKPEHLKFWATNQTGVFSKLTNLFGHMTKVKAENGEEFQIPESVLNLMTTAKDTSESKEKLLQKLSAQANQKPSGFFTLRTEKEKQILGHDLSKIDFRKKH